jgi:hypothetical protein
MNNEELGRLHLENKRRRTATAEDEDKKEQQPKYVMCLDLTNEEAREEDPENHEPEEEVQRRRRQRQQQQLTVLPVQDIELLEEAEKEFGEVIRPTHRSKDRLKKHRGHSKREPIVLCDDIRCDCIVRCIEGYECYASKHVQCINLIKKEGDVLKCYLCGSKIV